MRRIDPPVWRRVVSPRLTPPTRTGVQTFTTEFVAKVPKGWVPAFEPPPAQRRSARSRGAKEAGSQRPAAHS
ncbi:hypothetical protein GCM10010394_01070 [Streptomyces crystallinus]|uniref:Uncharacterized protein n=1 Tax=Streptomyces crystallinus TaxID=68191 RepID=A0ABN1EWJ6_9ACTN